MRAKNVPGSYKSAVDFLNGRDSRTVSGIRATKVTRIDEYRIALWYHNTPVVIWQDNGNTVLHTYDHYSVTTKQRMNQGMKDLGICVYQHKHEWYVMYRDGNYVTPFIEGMMV
jgi:hypothetical protein